MKVIATLQADLEMTPLGTRSRLVDDLHGIPVLRRTVEGLRRTKLLQGVYVLSPAEQAQRCVSLLGGTGAVVRPFDAPPPPWASLVQAARKWSLNGWRGGLGGTTSFDEYTDCRLIAELLKTVEADAVLSVPPGAVLVDPQLADRMIEQGLSFQNQARLTFTQAPPGITGVLLEKSIIHELVEKNTPLGWVLNYRPDDPRKDLIFQPCCMEIPAELRQATGRVIADTRRATETIEAILRDDDETDAVAIGRRLLEHDTAGLEPIPREVEIELTTDDPYPETLLRPRGRRVPRRGPIDPAVIEQVMGDMAHYDDSLVVLGGFGDPLRHPDLPSVLEALRPRAKDRPCVYGLAVRTAAVDLDDERIEMLIAHEVDVLHVMIDAWTAELYGRLQSPEDPAAANLDDVIERLGRVTRMCQGRKSVRPIVVPDMTKARENVHELDDFHDGWLRRVGAVTLTGHSHYGGQCQDRSVISMAPSAREPCRRIRWRGMILADGTVALCDQDFQGRHAVGRIGPPSRGEIRLTGAAVEALRCPPTPLGWERGDSERARPSGSLAEIWQGEALTRIRQAHLAQRFDSTPLCAACDEWHRQ